MLFRSGKMHAIDNAAPVRKACQHCGNTGDLKLHYAKAGPGLGVPILMFFSDRFVATTHKNYYMVCPTCDACLQVNKDVAKGLIGAS